MKNFIVTVLLFTTIISSQNFVDKDKLYSAYVLKENREKFISNLDNRIKNRFDVKDIVNEKEWLSILEDIELSNYIPSNFEMILRNAFKSSSNKSDLFRRRIIEASYTFFPNSFVNEISKIYSMTKDENVKAIAGYYLIKSDSSQIDSTKFISDLKLSFPNWEKSSLLFYLVNNLSYKKDRPDLTELLKHDFNSNKTIVYSLQRENRKNKGLVVIKNSKGKFVRNDDGSFFANPHLGLSVTNLPGIFRNGNTPQGIYSLVGMYVSPTETIGPTPNFIMRIPFEKPTSLFYHKRNKYDNWVIEDYKNILPESWKEFLPIYESFYAGKFGRKLIVSHGSTDNDTYFKDYPTYPILPTKGCLSSKEIWDETTGKLKESDQVELINALLKSGSTFGYVIVINIDDQEKDVTLDEIEKYLIEAEK
ncbi:MAG: hypothetical protein CMF23_12470 [Ignavibacteriae bacterium]|nr:hypothetical protein [Ignavibacteriota bacterium]